MISIKTEQEIELMEPNIVEPHDINEGYKINRKIYS